MSIEHETDTSRRPEDSPAGSESTTGKRRKRLGLQLVEIPVNQLYDSAIPVELTPSAARELEGLPRMIRARVMGIIARLERWPAVSGAKPLSGNLAGKHRVRTGDYRVQFHVRGDVVVIERIGHRDGFYKD
jgi:mRNA-degrading endonuclease RelE of RelBE toxin-antitoxin system